MDVFKIKQADREQAYRDLREELESDYACHVGLSMERNRRHQIAKMRGAAGHERQADTEEKRLEDDLKTYYRGTHEKFVLAILTGRYDFAVLVAENPRSPGGSSNTTWDDEIKQAVQIRQDEAKKGA